MTQELHVWTEKYLESDNLQETWPDSCNNQEKIIVTVRIVINQFLVDTILWFMIEYLVEELRR